MSKPGDWYCRSCQHLNFQRRDSCQRCGESRSGDFGAMVGGVAPRLGSPPARMFDLVTGIALLETVAPTILLAIPAASNVVHSRMTLLEVLTVTSHVQELLGGNRSGCKSGDWICTRSGCNEHNFASRVECFRCCAPRDLNTRTSY